MAERLAEDLWRLDIPLVGNPLKNLNSYLLTGERSLLIDTGFRQQPCREAMERQLAETHVDRDRLDIFCTHLHSDHTGLAPELIRPGCRIYIGEIDGPGVKNASDPSYWERLYGEYVRDGFTWAEMEALWGDNPAQTAAPPWREGLYTELRDGAALHYGGRTLRCVLTPGHTPGHLCLYDSDRRRLFCGDHVLFHITPNICRWQGAVSRPPGGDRGPAAADGGAEGPPRPPAGGHPADRGGGAGPHRLPDRGPDALEHPLPGLGGFSPGAEVLCRGRGPGPSGPSGGPRAGLPPGDTRKTGIFRRRGRQNMNDKGDASNASATTPCWPRRPPGRRSRPSATTA